MSPKPPRPLEERVAVAAEAALADHAYVSPLDIFTGMGFLPYAHVEDWRKGRVPHLEPLIQASDAKISQTKQLFAEWVKKHNLQPLETAYPARTRGPQHELQFSQDGNPDTERYFRVHYVPPELPEKKREKLQEKLSKPPELVVFDILRESQCAECSKQLRGGDFLFMEANRPLCLDCADLDHLVYLPRGDATLTRRARKNSVLAAVVVRFSRARRRYERQGTLVEEAALLKAEEECLSDADARAAQRERAAVRRVDEDVNFNSRLAARILELFPRCAPEEALTIAEHTSRRGSGRVGRSKAGRNLEEETVVLAVIASIRHRHTNYDELLMEGLDRASARGQVRDKIDRILRSWRSP